MAEDIVVIAGATGFVGSRLVERLRARGRPLRAGTRSPVVHRRQRPDLDWVELDVGRPDTLDHALDGAGVLVYLVHRLAEHGRGVDLAEREAGDAAAVLQACERHGIRRIVYLGGPRPPSKPSPHLAARLRTGEVLRSGRPSTIELRASMVIGAGSQSWQIVRDLALRLPIMVLPRWLDHRTQPVAADDVIAALAHAVDDPLEGSAVFDLPGPETLSGREILTRVAAQVQARPVMVPVPLLTPRLSSMWLKLVTRADYHVARQLVEGLTVDLLASGEGYWPRMPEHRRLGFDEAVRRALAEELPPGSRAVRAWERASRRLARLA